MDRETAQEVRDNLLAMRGILRLWSDPEHPDSPLAVDWLRGLLALAAEAYPADGPLRGEFEAIREMLADVESGTAPRDAPARLQDRMYRLVASVEREGGLPGPGE